MKFTVLTENTSFNPSLISEHGLSLYIETENHKILFDSGQSDAFEKNALKIGIDLTGVDIFFLSHGHYDHGGGLKRFLQINQTAKIYLSPLAFEHYYSQNGYIGLDESLKGNERLVFVDEVLRIDELTLYPANHLPTPYKVEAYGLEDKDHLPDNFNHEQYLVISEQKKILVSGCSHKGIFNICTFFKPDILIGGFHFMKIDTDNKECVMKLKQSSDILLSFDCTYYTCHCTGAEQFNILKQSMKDKLNYISTGDCFTL